MSINQAANETYTKNQVSIGSVSYSNGSVTFTESNQLDPDTLVIRTVNPDNTLAFTYVSGSNTVSGPGNLIANTTDGFIFSAPIFGETRYFFVSNGQQPSSGGTVTMPVESSSSPVYQAPPCYCPGTLIRTEQGDVAVERIRIGDRLVTVTGEVKPVRWIGTRAFSARFAAANPAVRPVRFCAGSLGTDAAGAPVPSRDLLVSPRHAMLIDGVLVAAELLVNDRTIVREGRGQDVTYIHVELPDHDAIWAENAASETFVDDSNRGMFHNAASYADMYPDVVAAEPMFCAARVDSGTVLEAIRRRLDAVGAPARRAA